MIMLEFKEPTNEAIIVYCPTMMRMCTLNLRNQMDHIPSEVALNPLGLTMDFSQRALALTQTPPNNRLHSLMNFIIWNVKEANSATFRRQCDTMVKMHKPAMLVLLETSMAEHLSLTKAFNFDAHIQSSAIGQSRGIVIMWKENLLKLDNISITPQAIHVMVKEK